MTLAPPSTGSKRYDHRVDSRPPSSVAKENSRPGSAVTTRPCRDHFMSPIGPPLLWPTNVAPSAGPREPAVHSTRWHSGLHWPMHSRSATMSYRRSAGALITAAALSWVSHHRGFLGVTGSSFHVGMEQKLILLAKPVNPHNLLCFQHDSAASGRSNHRAPGSWCTASRPADAAPA